MIPGTEVPQTDATQAATDLVLVLTNLPDVDVARRVARELVENRFAACVTLLPGSESVYRWQGVIESATEVPVLIKTRRSCYPALETELRRLHPYDVPEIVSIPIVDGLPAYLAWVMHESGTEDPGRSMTDRNS